MFSVETRVGRLVEARVVALRTLDDVAAYAARFRDIFDRLAPRQAVLCADHSGAALYSPEVTAALIALFTSLNPQIERAALLTGRSNATLAMQVTRMTREAQGSMRRAFADPTDVARWLGERLDVDERTRLRVFLAGPTPPPASRR